MRTYIVCWTYTSRRRLVDEYEVFCEDKPKKKAKKKYKEPLKDSKVYCVNICKLKKTTEHYE